MENKIKTVLIVDSSINGVISRAEGSGEGHWNSPEDGLHYRSTVADSMEIIQECFQPLFGSNNYLCHGMHYTDLMECTNLFC